MFDNNTEKVITKAKPRPHPLCASDNLCRARKKRIRYARTGRLQVTEANAAVRTLDRKYCG
jgi:hypothetical protein